MIKIKMTQNQQKFIATGSNFLEVSEEKIMQVINQIHSIVNDLSGKDKQSVEALLAKAIKAKYNHRIKQCQEPVVDLLAPGFSYKNITMKPCEYYIEINHEMCDHHLLEKFELTNGQYDSCDSEGMGELMYDESNIIQALRKAIGEE